MYVDVNVGADVCVYADGNVDVVRVCIRKCMLT